MVEIFEKFGLPVALIVILLSFIGVTLRLLWLYFTKKEEQYLAKLDAMQKQANEDRAQFLSSLNNQNGIAASLTSIATMLLTVKTSTEMLPGISAAIQNNLQNINELIEEIRKQNIRRAR